jgi:DNA-3-methyladenine glycosylase
MQWSAERIPRHQLEGDVEEVAREMLGRVVVAGHGGSAVAVRLTELEAYAGLNDPASHAYRGRTPRTAVMFGPAGHLYTYFVYGMHWCANIVTGPAGEASAVLLRAGRVVDGVDVASQRRERPGRAAPVEHQLARGPAGLATVLGVGAPSNGADLVAGDGPIRLLEGSPPAAGEVRVGPRVGVAAAADLQRRFWISDDPSVSAFRAWAPRNRARSNPSQRRSVAPAGPRPVR